LNKQAQQSRIVEIVIKVCTTHTHSVGVVLDKLMGDILEPLGAIYDSWSRLMMRFRLMVDTRQFYPKVLLWGLKLPREHA
jgi:hypothetical protein